MKNFDSNFVHTVFFWLKNPENENDKKKFINALSLFLEKSKYAKTKFIGAAPAPSRDVVDGSFTFKLMVTFESAEMHDAYQVEDAHLEFIETAKDLWEKVVVYDAIGI